MYNKVSEAELRYNAAKPVWDARDWFIEKRLRCADYDAANKLRDRIKLLGKLAEDIESGKVTEYDPALLHE